MQGRRVVGKKYLGKKIEIHFLYKSKCISILLGGENLLRLLRTAHRVTAV